MVKEKLKFLIIEDHPVYSKGLMIHLSSIFKNHDFHYEKTGTSAIKSINQTPYNVLIVDMNLPDMSGIELIQHLRNRHCNSKIITNSYDYLLYELLQLQKLDVDSILLKDEDLSIWDQSISHILENKKFYSKEIRLKLDKQIDHKLSTLTESEIAVVKLLCKGYNTDRIAEERGVSVNTVNTHKKNIFTKFEVHNAVELAVKVIKKGIV